MRLTALGLLLAMVFLFSCGEDSVNEPPDALTGPAAALKAIPFPDGSIAGRNASVADELWVAGRFAFLEGGSTLPVGDTLVLTATSGQLTWAIYELFPGNFQIEQVMSNLSDVSVLDNLYIGVANYGRHSWDWTTGFSGSPALNVVGRDVVSPGGGMYIAVACWDDTSATVHKLWVETESPEWVAFPLNPAGLSGERHSMARVGGRPAVLLEDPTGGGNYDLFYYYATADLPGFADWTPTLVESGYPSPYKALELIDSGGGRPAFASISNANQLYYRYSSDIPPVSGVSWVPTFIDSTLGSELALTIAGGTPAVAYTGTCPACGEAVKYARSDTLLPNLPGAWVKASVAETADPSQTYEGIGMACLLDGTVAVTYFDDTVKGLYYWTRSNPDPALLGVVFDTLVDDPWIGGPAWPIVVNYTGHAALVYDIGQGLLPGFALPSIDQPEGPGDFARRHIVSHMGADSPAVATNSGTIGIAFRDYRDGSIKYGWFDTDDPVGDGILDSGDDWRFVTVDERQTYGDISLCYLFGGVPAVGYNVSADGNFYFARLVPTT